MGNTPSSPAEDTSYHNFNVLATYQQLISKDFDDEISLIAANKYPHNLNKAVDFILNSTSEHEQQSNVSNDSQATGTVAGTDDEEQELKDHATTKRTNHQIENASSHTTTEDREPSLEPARWNCHRCSFENNASAKAWYGGFNIYLFEGMNHIINIFSLMCNAEIMVRPMLEAIEEDTECDDLKSCESLLQLVKVLKYYKQQMECSDSKNNEEIYEFFNENKQFIICL